MVGPGVGDEVVGMDVGEIDGMSLGVEVGAVGARVVGSSVNVVGLIVGESVSATGDAVGSVKSYPTLRTSTGPKAWKVNSVIVPITVNTAPYTNFWSVPLPTTNLFPVVSKITWIPLIVAPPLIQISLLRKTKIAAEASTKSTSPARKITGLVTGVLNSIVMGPPNMELSL